MTHRSRWALGAVAVVALLVGFVATSAIERGQHRDRGERTIAASVTSNRPDGVRTSLPGLTPASGEPTLPGFDTARPAVGTVARVAGPFDDRFAWSHLQLASGRLSGDLTVTSDVSELLELEVLVGFYDATGRLLQVSRAVTHTSLHQQPASDVPDESQRVVVDIPQDLRRSAVAAAVGVPVLVNE